MLAIFMIIYYSSFRYKKKKNQTKVDVYGLNLICYDFFFLRNNHNLNMILFDISRFIL